MKSNVMRICKLRTIKERKYKSFNSLIEQNINKFDSERDMRVIYCLRL